MVRGTREVQFDVSFHVRISLSFVLFSVLSFFTDLLSCFLLKENKLTAGKICIQWIDKTLN